MGEKLEKRHKNKYYKGFSKINGEHPLREVSTDSFIDYRVRSRKGGKLAAFNFDLAREMGLISKSHPEEINPELESAVLDTFSLVIINEYDQINNIKFKEEDIKPNNYMATRYLQLQHPNKKGETSGDGRSIWNGCYAHNGKTWDISSCGTGATRLSPATHIFNKFYQTGDPSVSYGCGYSEIDEGLCTLFFSEIMKRNSIATERILGIIEFSNNMAITIRVHENLLRPSHFFNHLKQANYDALEKITNYYIARQEESGRWENVPASQSKRWEYFLDKQIEVFASMTANFEDEYIFCWLDWDGDNILMDGSIIDYGSVRQFGLYHSEYRYDDVERFSTSLEEQKNKAKYICQTFIQIIDYLKTKKKKNIKEFATHQKLQYFEDIYVDRKNSNLLYKIGFTKEQVAYLLNNKLEIVKQFKKAFKYFETAKSVQGIHKVSDGINWNAIFCMRDILRELPQLLLDREENIEKEEFVDIIKSSYALKDDLVISAYREQKIKDFQTLYWQLMQNCAKRFRTSLNKTLLDVCIRSSIINKYDRVTGDSITTIVEKMMKSRPRLTPEKLYSVLKTFTEYQNLNPDTKKKVSRKESDQSKLLKTMFVIVRDYREGL